MDINKMNINKTKYRYFMDNFSVFPIKTIMKYTIPVPKGPETKETEFYDREYPEVEISNIKFNEMIEKTSKALIAQGVKKGDIITVCQTNTPEIMYMDYAASKIGARINYIYPNITAEEMRYYIEELDSKYLFILDDEPIRKNANKATCNMDIKIISSTPIESFPLEFKMMATKGMEGFIPTSLNNEIKWDEFIESGKEIKEVKEVAYEPNSVCSYIRSSGTSNTPKAIAETNENVNSVTRNYALDGVYYSKDCVCVQTIPQFVEYGKTSNHMLLCNNVCLVFIPEMEPKNFYDLIKKYKPEYSFATPSHARELIKRPTDMSNSKIIFFGGDGFDDVEEDMNKYIKDNGGNVPAYQGYGSTEMSAITIINSPINHRVGSIGKLMGEVEGVIIKPSGDTEVIEIIDEPNVKGELCLTGPGVTLGYAGNSKEQTEKVFKKHPDGKTYVHMGDYISRDEDGFYYFHGRIKNVITRKSFTFSPEEIVVAIMKHSNVKQCLVVPKYSKEEGETPSAHIILEDYGEKEKTMNEIIELVKENVQEFHWPTDYKIREKILRTRNNKNNITSLKIEDSAMLFNGVVNANIESLEDGEYEYLLEIEFDGEKTSLSKEELAKHIDTHIRKIANYIKFNVGNIKYDIKYIKLNYVDKDDLQKSKTESKTYVKHI